MHPYNQPGRWQDARPAIDQAASTMHFVGSYYIDISLCTV